MVKPNSSFRMPNHVRAIHQPAHPADRWNFRQLRNGGRGTRSSTPVQMGRSDYRSSRRPSDLARNRQMPPRQPGAIRPETLVWSWCRRRNHHEDLFWPPTSPGRPRPALVAVQHPGQQTSAVLTTIGSLTGSTWHKFILFQSIFRVSVCSRRDGLMVLYMNSAL